MRRGLVIVLAFVLAASCAPPPAQPPPDRVVPAPSPAASRLPALRLPVDPAPDAKLDLRFRRDLLPHVRGETRVRLVVDLAEQVDLFAFGRLADGARLPRDERRRLVARELGEGLPAARRLAEELRRRPEISDVVESRCLGRLALSGPARLARELAAREDVAWIWGRALAPPVDAAPRPPAPSPQREARTSRAPEGWAFEALGASRFWAAGMKGRGVHVAVLDSAASAEPAALAGRRADVARAPPGAELADEGEGHGYGVLAAAVGAGGLGLAPEATWSVANPLGGGVLDPEAFAAAIDWLLLDAQPDVVIVPWDVPAGELAGHQLALPFGALRTAGMAVVFPAGNEGPAAGVNRPPANLVGLAPDGAPAFSVGGVAPGLEAYPASSRGPSAHDGSPFPQVVAPGSRLAVLDAATGGSREGHGTSYSAGYAAGALALVLEMDAARTGPEAEAMLRAGARDLGAPGHDAVFGHGLIDLTALRVAAP